MPTRPRFPDEEILSPRRDVLELPDPIQVVALGDSVMWGQGNTRSDRFAWQFAFSLGLPALHDRSRSGARIRPREDRQRDDFIDTFPTLFRTRPARDRFLAGDEGAAADLHGEVPATFPTVLWQARTVPEKTAAEAGVVLVSGGANDVGFEDVINPEIETAHWSQIFAPRIRGACYHDMLELLRTVRHRMPNAVVLVFGYYAALSYASRRKRIKAFFEHEVDSEIAWWFNEQFGFRDIDRLVYLARVRSVWAHGLSSYWLRRAVHAANSDDELRGPGVVFVPSGFDRANALFAPEPWVWDDYTDPAEDPARTERFSEVRRAEHLDELLAVWKELDAYDTDGPRDSTRQLAEKIDGPSALKASLTDGGVRREKTVRALLTEEIGRIRRGLIASFLHPNRLGAESYTRMAIARYRAHVDLRDSLPTLPDFDGGAVHGIETFAEMLLRCGLRGQGDLRADLGHQFVDTLRVTTWTREDSDPNLAPDVFIVLGLKETSEGFRHRLNFQYYRPGAIVEKFLPHFEPGRSHSYALDTGGSIRLADLRSVRLRLGRMPRGVVGGSRWRPERVLLEVNGVKVADRSDLANTVLGPREELDLHYPPPPPEEPVFV